MDNRLSNALRSFRVSGNIPFGLTNAHTVFQHMITNIFPKYLDHFIVMYLDEILVFSLNIKEHTHDVRLVVTELREHGLNAKSENC